MRNYLFILLPLFLIAISCDEDIVSDSQTESFVKYYGGSFKDEGLRVVSLSDSGYLLMGNIETPDRGKDICVIITDKLGNSTGPAILYGGNYNDYGKVIKKNAQGYVIGGSTQESKDGKKNIFLVQISENGTNLLSKRIPSNTNEEVNDLIILDDQSLVLTGYTTNSGNNKNNMLFKRTNYLFELSDTNIKPFGKTLRDEVAYAITKSDDPDYFLLAGYTDRSSDDPTKKVLIVKWDGYYPIPFVNSSDTDDAYAVSLIPQEDNTCYAICNVNSESKKQIKVKKISIGKEIQQQWEKYYGENEIDEASYGFTYNNKIYILGTSGQDIYGNILFIEMENDGSSWMYHYVGDGISFQGHGFDFTPDQGIVIAGSNKQNENSLITLIKLKSNFSL